MWARCRFGFAGLALALLSWTAVADAQDRAIATVDPRLFGLSIPIGPVRRGVDERVLVAVEGEPTVARLYCEIGETRIALLPDGRLKPLPRAQAPDTDRPFVPASREALAERWTTDRLAGFQSKVTRHYVFVYNTSEEMQIVTSRILESMVPGVQGFAEVMKVKVQEPELPLLVLMFRTEAEFQKFQKMPPGVVAYYNVLENYIVLHEESPLKNVKRELAIQQILSSIAHEGAHQILNNTGVQQRLSLWPMWLSEGLAEYLAPTSFGKNFRWKGAGQVNDLRMFELERYLKSRDADGPNGELIEHSVLAARLTSTGYATSWALTHFLAKQQRPEFQKYLVEMSRLGPFQGEGRIEAPGVVPGQLSAFRDRFGGDLTELERRLVLHLKKLNYTDPFAEWPHFVAMVTSGSTARPKRDANVFHTPDDAEKWNKQTVAKLADDQRESAQVAVQTFPNRASAEAFARKWLSGR